MTEKKDNGNRTLKEEKNDLKKRNKEETRKKQSKKISKT